MKDNVKKLAGILQNHTRVIAEDVIGKRFGILMSDYKKVAQAILDAGYIQKDDIAEKEKLLRFDICSLVKAEAISMDRAREILDVRYADMRKIYEDYAQSKDVIKIKEVK